MGLCSLVCPSPYHSSCSVCLSGSLHHEHCQLGSCQLLIPSECLNQKEGKARNNEFCYYPRHRSSTMTSLDYHIITPVSRLIILRLMQDGCHDHDSKQLGGAQTDLAPNSLSSQDYTKHPKALNAPSLFHLWFCIESEHGC